MKARIKGWKSLISGDGSRNGIYEADSIEIIEESNGSTNSPQRKREVRMGDVWMDGNKLVVLLAPFDRCKLDWLTTETRSDLDNYQFNLLDLIAEMQKAQDGKTERMMSWYVPDNAYAEARVNNQTIRLAIKTPNSDEEIINLSSKNAFRFAAQLLALCREAVR